MCPHDIWQLDAHRVATVLGVGRTCLINGIDVASRLRVESFPSVGTTNPPTEDYFLMLRRAFRTHGLPRCISFDHGTVFYGNTTPSPFRTRLHLWLIALGVQVRFIRKSRPTDHGIFEHTHQIMTRQAVDGQSWSDPQALWDGLDERRERLNTWLPSAALGQQARLQACPAAKHSGREYRPEWEDALRDPDTGMSLCTPEGKRDAVAVAVQGLTTPELMGELAGMVRLPAYQLALPLFSAAVREQVSVTALTGTSYRDSAVPF